MACPLQQLADNLLLTPLLGLHHGLLQLLSDNLLLTPPPGRHHALPPLFLFTNFWLQALAVALMRKQEIDE